MRECDKSKNTCKQQLPMVYMSFNNVGHLITSTITILQHFATLNHTSPNYTSLHLSTLHFLSFTLHYSPIWLNPSTFPTVLFHLTSLNQTQYSSPISKLISKLMKPIRTSHHFTSLHFFFHLSYQSFISFYFAIHIYNSLHFTSLHFLWPSLPLTGLQFPSPRFENTHFTVGSPYHHFRQQVPVSNGPIHTGVFPDVCSLFSGFDFPMMIDPT